MEDRSWMYKRYVPGVKGITTEFVTGVENFLRYALAKVATSPNPNEVRCPCVKCNNLRYHTAEEIKLHLYRKGFTKNYYNWTCHGEEFNTLPQMSSNARVVGDASRSTNQYREMVMDAAGPSFHQDSSTPTTEEPPNSEAQKFYDMLSAADTPIWEGCTSHSLLSVVAQLLNIKSENNMSEKCFNQVIKLMKEVLPQGNKMPDDFYQTKKLVAGLGLPVQKIDVCSNGCMLFWRDDVDRRDCKFCSHPRYISRKKMGKNKQKKEIPFKRMYYFPITPRLQRLYASKTTAEHMRWHSESPTEEGVMNHPRDGEAWQHFDRTYPEFASEVRNVRLGLCTDGFAPYGISGKQYSSWPVIITPYNLPPWMCMKNSVMFLTIIIPGPKNPKQKLDVYLQPLIDELKQLWFDGVQTYDISKKQNFQLRAALQWTISDFPAYGMLSGWSTAGKLACPCCMERTKSFQLEAGGKQCWFDCHRQFLPFEHPFRRDTKSFRRDKGEERCPPPPRNSGDQMWNRVCHLPKIIETATELGKSDGRGEFHNWAKQSIFWDLPYWRTNLIRHNIDVMHNEKNVFDNVLNTVMDVKGKTKDNVKARRDLLKYCNRPELCISREANGKVSIPKACYTLTKEQKRLLLEWVKELRLPDGYASNLGRCVDLKDMKMSGMKSHDCHVFMERLLPIALRELLPTNIWNVLTELSLFYRDLCAPKLSFAHMCKLEKEIAQLVCKLEKIFPPGFFDVMEHLIVHLPYEARVGGPVQYRWMYPFERYLHHLKLKVKNKARVEGSICNAYLVEEASTFFSYYFEPHVQTRHTTIARNDVDDLDALVQEPVLSICVNSGRPIGKSKTRYLTTEEFKAATNYILLNCEEVQPYVNKFKENLRSLVPTISDLEVERRFQNEFPGWFRAYVHDPQNREDNVCLKNLSWGPSAQVKSFNGYIINGFRFHTSSLGEGKKTVNSGVCVKGGGDGMLGNDYYGVLKEIIEIEFVGTPIQKTVLFKCDWFDTTSNRGTRIHSQYKLVDINHKRSYAAFDPFVLAHQATQVYYASYPGIKRPKSDWLAVCKTKARHVIDAPMVDKAYQQDVDEAETISISIGDDIGPLGHESGEKETVDAEAEYITTDENDSNQHQDESDIDWETDDESDDIDEEYVSDDESD